MPKLPGVNHQDAIRAFERLGYWIKRQSKHVPMTSGANIIVIPGNNLINANTMGSIIHDTGLTIGEFEKLL